MTNIKELPNTILFIEDDPGLILLMRERLMFTGKEFAEVYDGEEALEWLAGNRPALMIVDYALKDMKITELLDALKRNNIDTPPFIVTTGFGDERLVVDMMHRGTLDYIIKDSQFLGVLEMSVRRSLKNIENEIELKKAQESLAASSKSYRELVENLNDAIYKVGINGVMIYMSTAIQHIAGYTPEEIIGTTFDEFIHPEDAERIRDSFTNVLKNILNPNEFRIRKKDGAYCWVRTSSRPWYENGELQGIQGVMSDISERKEIEFRLIENQNRYRLITENTRDTIWLMDMNFRTSWISPSVERLRGFSLDELRELPLDKQLTPGTLDKFWKYVGEILTEENLKNPQKDIIISGEAEFYKKNGETFWGDTILTLLRDQKGNPLGWLGIGRDITEKKRLEDQLLQAQKMEAIGRMAGGVAHDFNNLLTVIMGHTQIAMMSMKADSELFNDFEQVRKAAERASDLTRQLLIFSRKHISEFKVVDVNSVITNLDKMLRRLIREDISYNCNLEQGLPSVRIDPTQMEQVIMNLTVNARDAITGTGKITISTELETVETPFIANSYFTIKPGTYVKISVADTGCGMPPEVIEKCFEPFFTTKETGKGTGLGLSTVFGIVKQIDGAVNIDSAVGEGTTMSVFIPAVSEKADSTVEKSMKIVSAPAGEYSILIVEDEDDLRKTMEKILTKLGYVVHTAKNGAEAFILCEKMKKPVDLVITDMVMPVMGGDELRDRLEVFWPELKVLFISGYVPENVMLREQLKPGENFLQKPFSIEKLAQTARSILLR